MRKAQTVADVLGEGGFAKNLTKADLEYLAVEDQREGSKDNPRRFPLVKA